MIIAITFVAGINDFSFRYANRAVVVIIAIAPKTQNIVVLPRGVFAFLFLVGVEVPQVLVKCQSCYFSEGGVLGFRDFGECLVDLNGNAGRYVCGLRLFATGVVLGRGCQGSS